MTRSLNRHRSIGNIPVSNIKL